MTTMQMMTPAGAATGMAALKAALHNSWTAGDYDYFSRFMENGARAFYERLSLLPGMRMLDVACGSGQLALIAARDGVRATGVDIAENLVERGRARAMAEGLPARFEAADAEDLPFEDETFDVVTSLIGAMFAPRPERVASELARVCVPGGTIAMGNWTAAGFVGKMFKTFARFISPPGMPSPLLWGDPSTVRERFAGLASGLEFARRMYVFNYPFPPGEVVDFFRRFYGPANRAFAALDAEGKSELHAELEALWTIHNKAGGGITVVEAEYLEVVATRM